VLRSDAPAGFVTATCVVSGTSATSASDTTVPGTEAALLAYLVRARNVCGGDLGTDSAGQPRQGATCP
jgi:hypothetical protein